MWSKGTGHMLDSYSETVVQVAICDRLKRRAMKQFVAKVRLQDRDRDRDRARSSAVQYSYQ